MCIYSDSKVPVEKVKPAVRKGTKNIYSLHFILGKNSGPLTCFSPHCPLIYYNYILSILSFMKCVFFMVL